MRKHNVLFIGFSLVLISGCATATFTQTGKTYPKYKGPVMVFGDNPEGVVYIEIGRISSRHGIFRDNTSLLKAIQKKAAKKGANAIVLVSNIPTTQRASLPDEGYGFYSGLQTNQNMTAVAIRIINAQTNTLTADDDTALQ